MINFDFRDIFSLISHFATLAMCSHQFLVHLSSLFLMDRSLFIISRRVVKFTTWERRSPLPGRVIVLSNRIWSSGAGSKIGGPLSAGSSTRNGDCLETDLSTSSNATIPVYAQNSRKILFYPLLRSSVVSRKIIGVKGRGVYGNLLES